MTGEVARLDPLGSIVEQQNKARCKAVLVKIQPEEQGRFRKRQSIKSHSMEVLSGEGANLLNEDKSFSIMQLRPHSSSEKVHSYSRKVRVYASHVAFEMCFNE